jgi:hypothetical protein
MLGEQQNYAETVRAWEAGEGRGCGVRKKKGGK